jgi:hypothetical protein
MGLTEPGDVRQEKDSDCGDDFGYDGQESGSRGGTMKNKANNNRTLLPSRDRKRLSGWTLSKSDRRFLRSCNISPA